MNIPNLITAARIDIARADELSKRAATRGQMIHIESYELLILLRRATAAVQEIDNQLAGNKPPKVGE